MGAARDHANGTGYASGWALAVVAGSFALLVQGRRLGGDEPEGLALAMTDLMTVPLVLLLLLACWLVRRDGPLVSLAAASFAAAVLASPRGALPGLLLVGLALLLAAGVRGRLRQRAARAPGNRAPTRVDP